MEKVLSTRNISYEDWKNARRQGIGGSDAAAVCGLNRWKSPLAVYLEKIGEIENDIDNEQMYWGRVLEDVVAREFAKRTKMKVRNVNFIVRHPLYPFMIANLDRKIERKPYLLECKTTSVYRADEWKDSIPQEYALQVHHYLAVTGYQKAYVAVLIGGQKFVIREIGRDPEIIEYLIKIEKEFWQMVETRTPPAIDGSDEAKRILDLLYPVAVQKNPIQLDNSVNALIEDRNALAKQIKQLEVLKNEKENQLKALLKGNESGKTDKYIVQWKNVQSSRFDLKGFREAHNELYQEYSKPVIYRRFMIKEVKNHE